MSGAIANIRFVDITQSKRVQSRLSLAKKALAGVSGVGCSFTRVVPMAQRVAENLTEEDRSRMGAHLCFAGDLSVMVHGFGIKNWIGLEARPFFNRDVEDHLGNNFQFFFRTFPEEILLRSARERVFYGYLHNTHLRQFGEVASFLFFDIVSSNAENIKVYKAVDTNKLFKVSFDLGEERYRVLVLQETLTAGVMPDLLSGLPLGVVLIKAARGGPANPYAALETILPNFSKGALIISDRALGASCLSRKAFDITPLYDICGIECEDDDSPVDRVPLSHFYRIT